MVTEKLLKEFKEEMNISHSSEDDKLKGLLSRSIIYVESKCGRFNIEGDRHTDIRAKELVFNRARYAYNDAVEYFEDNFLSEITSLGIEMAGEFNEE